jgi:hypothetical protein
MSTHNQTKSDAPDNPLDFLEARIHEAKTPERLLESVSTRDSKDPLVRINSLIERARDAEASELITASYPLSNLLEKIDNARRLETPEQNTSQTLDEPFEHLKDKLSDEIDAVGGIKPPTLVDKQRQATGNIEAKVGKKVLQMLEQQPLSGPARREAVEVLAGAERGNLEQSMDRLLELLIQGKP